MAKESIKARDRKRRKLNEKYAEKRKILLIEKKEEEKKDGDLQLYYQKLDKLPKNSSSVRLRNRCQVTGRSRGYIRRFGISRIVFREMASAGKIPGIKKAS